MDLNGFKWHGTLRQLEELMADTGGMLDDSKGWNVASQKEMEEYTATTFIAKARFELVKSAPDLGQSAEKIWLAAACAVKELYLSCGGIDLKSQDALLLFGHFAISNSGLSFGRRHDLRSGCWDKVQELRRDVYGFGQFHEREYAQIISDVEVFVRELANIDRMKLLAEFEKKYILGTNDKVKIEKVAGNIKLGGHIFECHYSVYL